MPGYNLQTYKDKFLELIVEWSHQTTVPLDLNESVIFSGLNEGLRRCQAELKLQTLRERKNLTADTMSYDIPLTLMGRQINTVEVVSETSNDRTELVQLDYSDFIDRYDQDNPSDDTGNPKHWTYAAGFAATTAATDSERQILVGPPPSYTKTNALIFYAFAEAALAGRNLQGANPPGAVATSLKATTSNGSKVVTFHNQSDVLTGSHIDVELQVGDEIGFMPTVHSDGTSLTTTSPYKWYSVQSTAAGSSTVSLSETFKERALTKVTTWISAEVSEIERASPGVLGWTPVYLALADYLAAKDPGKADYFRSLGMERLVSSNPRTPTRWTRAAGPDMRTNWAFRRAG